MQISNKSHQQDEGQPYDHLFYGKKAIEDKPASSITLNGEKQKALPFKSETSMSTLTTQYSAESFSKSNQGEERMGIKIGKQPS